VLDDADERPRPALLVLVSGLAGLLVAGLLLPVVGGLALVARAGIDQFNRLPGVLQVPPVPEVSRLVTRSGRTIATFYYQDRVPVPLSAVPKVMRNALIDIEDDRFYHDGGIDFRAVVRALVRNGAAGGVVQGGSTLTQQYVKNILLESATTKAQQQAAIADTLSRKIREAKYAIQLAHRESKAQILEGYLNIAYFGDGAYGIGAAARHYFGIRVQRLNLAQSALLAGLVQDPSAYDPVYYPGIARARRNVVLTRMYQLGTISRSQELAAMKQPLRLHVTRQPNGCQGTIAPFFCDYVLAELRFDPALGRTEQQRVTSLLRGGLTVVTTLNPKAQRAAQVAVDKKVGTHSRFAAAIAMVQPGTGQLEAMTENRVFGTGRGQTEVNYAADYRYGGSLGFQTGSAFKVFTLAAAMKEGIPLTLTLPAPPTITMNGFVNCQTGAVFPPWTVHNAEAAEGGVFNIPQATWASVNTFYVQLEKRTGLCAPADIAESMGVRQASGAPLQRVPSMTLGVNTLSPTDMAGAMATFAAHGLYCPVTAVLRILDRDRHVISAPRPQCRQVLDPGLADTETRVLQGVINNPSGTAYGVASLGRPAAGKTGTMDNFISAWFVGYTPNLAAAVAVGDPNGGQHDPMINVTINGQQYPYVFGATIPAPIWQLAMSGALAGTPVQQFAPASSRYEFGKMVMVPDVSGLSPAQAVAAIDAAGLSASVQPGQVPSSSPAGTVAFTAPSAGARVPVTSVVDIYVSNGHPSASPSPSPSPSPTHPPKPSPTSTPSPPPPRHHHHKKP
jgi:membrane peptidoglycan carboxypeptidase